MGIKQHVPDNQWFKEEIKKEIILSGNKLICKYKISKSMKFYKSNS